MTDDTPVARELLTEGLDALLVRRANPETLARRLGAAGRAIYEKHASEKDLGTRRRDLLEKVVERPQPVGQLGACIPDWRGRGIGS